MLTAESPFIRRGHRRSPALRLFCMPYAGAGASIFTRWPELLPDEIEVVAVQLPGREDRRLEPPFEHVEQLVRAVGQSLRPYLQAPFAFFGHCAGALLAFELARELRRRLGVEPHHLFVSAQAAPHLPPDDQALHALPDAELKLELHRLGGTPPALLTDDSDLIDFLLPCVRADFTLWERYVCTTGAPLTCPITAFGGVDDPRATAEELRGWQAHTSGAFELQLFDGGHFFVNERADDVAGAITRALAASESPTAQAARR
jgi:medium-chain acyl-[acyl-carrier-protein] hydrolase